ncbi:hypothetical protein HanHA300_Chr07g0260571 [Helianthus annuus]|nr:hypothetical protein HanHA300_Chr07g0260571 [Helianthus annuus]
MLRALFERVFFYLRAAFLVLSLLGFGAYSKKVRFESDFFFFCGDQRLTYLVWGLGIPSILAMNKILILKIQMIMTPKRLKTWSSNPKMLMYFVHMLRISRVGYWYVNIIEDPDGDLDHYVHNDTDITDFPLCRAYDLGFMFHV